jgi:hypothetical protein
MFYFITFFVQLVRDYSALKTGFAFLPVALMIGVVAQVVAKLLPRVGPKPLVMSGTVLLTGSMLWLSRVSVGSSYAGTLLPGMLVLAMAMGLLFVPLTATAVAGVKDTYAGLASALLNVGQQVGGAIGLSVLATVFQTSANNFAAAHKGELTKQVMELGPQLGPKVGQRLADAGQNGLQPHDIATFIGGLPRQLQGPAAQFFSGPYHEFSRELQAHASGMGFIGAAVFGAVAILVAVFVINARKADVPADPAEVLAH